MNTPTPRNQKTATPTARPQAGLPVRTDVRAGQWNCSDCQGQVNGNTLFRPTCGYCQPA
jgi:hypothetical protein